MPSVVVLFMFIQPRTSVEVVMEVSEVSGRINIGTDTVIIDGYPCKVSVHCVYL